MGTKPGEVPKYLVCVRTLALVGGIATGGAGCSSTENPPPPTDAKQDVYEGGVVGVTIYDGGPMGTAPYDAGPVGIAPYDGGFAGSRPAIDAEEDH